MKPRQPQIVIIWKVPIPAERMLWQIREREDGVCLRLSVLLQKGVFYLG